MSEEKITETIDETHNGCCCDEKNELSDLETELKEAEEKAAENYDLYLRCYAEFDNFKKRTLKEKSALYADSVADTVSAILPVIDNFERGLSTQVSNEEAVKFKEGIEMIFKQLMETLTKLGVTEIETEGKEFDPLLHEAVMHIEDDNYGEQEIVETLQKGYMFKDKVIRHSKVKVAN